MRKGKGGLRAFEDEEQSGRELEADAVCAVLALPGSGVIGQYPILEAGGEPFTYQSCTHQPGHLGYMEGDFK